MVCPYFQSSKMKNLFFHQFSITTQKIITSNSINECRKVNWQEIENILNDAGCPISDITRDFFSMFAYCEIRFCNLENNNWQDRLVSDPTGCIDLADRIDLKNTFDLNLCPLGYLSQGEDVMVDENEKLYVFYCGIMYLVADNLISGIEEIINGKNWWLNPTINPTTY
jgi:hypothetical protein